MVSRWVMKLVLSFVSENPFRVSIFSQTSNVTPKNFLFATKHTLSLDRARQCGGTEMSQSHRQMIHSIRWLNTVATDNQSHVYVSGPRGPHPTAAPNPAAASNSPVRAAARLRHPITIRRPRDLLCLRCVPPHEVEVHFPSKPLSLSPPLLYLTPKPRALSVLLLILAAACLALASLGRTSFFLIPDVLDGALYYGEKFWRKSFTAIPACLLWLCGRPVRRNDWYKGIDWSLCCLASSALLILNKLTVSFCCLVSTLLWFSKNCSWANDASVVIL